MKQGCICITGALSGLRITILTSWRTLTREAASSLSNLSSTSGGIRKTEPKVPVFFSSEVPVPRAVNMRGPFIVISSCFTGSGRIFASPDLTG
jgi:hypothetical protein